MRNIETPPLTTPEQAESVQKIVSSFMRLEEKYNAAITENESGNEKIDRHNSASSSKGSRVIGRLRTTTGEFLDFQVDPNIELPYIQGSMQFEMKVSSLHKGEPKPHIAKFNLNWENPLLSKQTKENIKSAVREIVRMQLSQ